jgi:hypothetical protein
MKTLKIKSLILAIALLIGVGAHAQEFHYGINAGTNFAVQSEIADYYNNENIRTGLHVGLFGNMSLSEKFQLQAEINYDQKGGKSDDVTSKTDYISVPVLVKYSLGKSDNTKLKFNINIGPYASYLVNAETEANDITTDIKDNTEDFEFGAIAGFGMKYPIANNNLTFDLRLGLGLTDFDKNNSDSKNKYIGLSLGYEF